METDMKISQDMKTTQTADNNEYKNKKDDKVY